MSHDLRLINKKQEFCATKINFLLYAHIISYQIHEKMKKLFINDDKIKLQFN